MWCSHGRWFRFSLRAFLLLFTALAVWISFTAERARRQRAAVMAIRDVGGQAYYHNGFDENGNLLYGGRPHGPESLRKLLGDDYFADVVYVELNGSDITDDDIERLKGLLGLRWLDLRDTRVTEHGLAKLKEFPRLENLDLWRTQVTRKGLAKLKTLTRIKQLILARTPVTDDCLEHVAEMHGLRELLLGATQITDASLQNLKSLRNLRKLDLPNHISEYAIEDLQAALPECSITH